MNRSASLAAFILAIGFVATDGPAVVIEATGSQSVDPHAYFDALVARPDHAASYSLRDSAQLDHPKNGGFAHSNSRDLVVTYDPANDPYPRRQDGAKVALSTSSNSLRNQVRMPIPAHHPESLLVVWDVWFGAEWSKGTSGLDTHKTWQLASPADEIHTEVRTRYRMGNGPSDIAMTDVRQYNGKWSRGPNTSIPVRYGDNAYGNDSLGPMSGEFMVQADTWTRYFAFFDSPDVAGWYRFSLWVADEDRDPVRVIDARQIKPTDGSGGWRSFWLEYNTSKSDVLPGRPELVSYARNVVMLKGVGDPSGVLKRPNAGLPLPPPTVVVPSAPRNLRILPPPPFDLF